MQRQLTLPSAPSTPRHRGHNHTHSLTLARSQDGYTRNGSHSPERGMGRRTGVLNGSSSSPLGSPATITTPLLMPPPTTRMEQLRHHGVITLYHAKTLVDYYDPFLRTVLLGLKLFSLSWVCWPYSSNLGILASLFTLAALDFWPLSGPPSGAIGFRPNRDVVRVGVAGVAGYDSADTGGNRWRRSCTLLALHCITLWVTSRFGILCAAAHHEKWADW